MSFLLRASTPALLRASTPALLISLGLWGVSPAGASSLRGSQSSIEKQYRAAQHLNLSPVRNTKELHRFVDQGLLVEVSGNTDYELGSGVSFPYARASTRAFVERLAGEYHAFTGERLVVTSLTRPMSRQPRNASSLSVHPMGIAVDFRRPQTTKARRWIEQKLRSLETEGVIEATHERRPPHYHVAVFPDHVDAYAGTDRPVHTPAVSAPAPVVQASSQLPSAPEAPYLSYKVRRGDTLWTISKRYETSVDRLRKLNGLGTSLLHPGQVLMVPQGNWE